MRLRYAGIPKAIMMAKFPLLRHHTHRGAWHGMAWQKRRGNERGGGGSANKIGNVKTKTKKAKHDEPRTIVLATFN